MKVVEDLRAFDARLLPDAARRFARLQHLAQSTRTRSRHLFHPLPARVRTNVFDSLDAAVAARRWGLPARQPTVALVVALGVLIGGLSVAATRPAPGHRLASTTSSTDPGVDSTYVGPHVGDDIKVYVGERQQALDRQVKAHPGATSVAVVSFADYVSIEGAAALVGGLKPRRVFFGVHIAKVPTEMGQATVTDLVADTTAAFKANAKARSRLAVTFKQLSDAAPSRTDAERKFRAFYRTFAEANRIEAARLGTLCACVLAVVVEGRLDALKTLSESAAVRLVDIAPVGVAVDRLGFRPITPEEKGKITSGPSSPLAELSR